MVGAKQFDLLAQNRSAEILDRHSDSLNRPRPGKIGVRSRLIVHDADFVGRVVGQTWPAESQQRYYAQNAQADFLADQGLFPALRWSWVRSSSDFDADSSIRQPACQSNVRGWAGARLRALDMSDLDRWELINDRWGLNYGFDKPIAWLEPPFKRETSKALRAH